MLLPDVERSLREAISLKKRFEDAHNAVEAFTQRVAMRGGMLIDRDDVMRGRAEREESGNLLQGVINKLEEEGVLIKDLDIGLIDFPTLFRGKEVYLCWKLGENGINHWHGVDEGFAGRKPIDAEFLANHTGDRAN